MDFDWLKVFKFISILGVHNLRTYNAKLCRCVRSLSPKSWSKCSHLPILWAVFFTGKSAHKTCSSRTFERRCWHWSCKFTYEYISHHLKRLIHFHDKFCFFFLFLKKFNEQKMMEMDDAIGFNESHIECGPSISSAPSKSILKNRTRIANDKAASSNGFNTDPIVIDTEPLNLTTTNCNEPLDLSIKNPK